MCLQRSPSALNSPVGIQRAHSHFAGNCPSRTRIVEGTATTTITGAYDGNNHHEPSLETLASKHQKLPPPAPTTHLSDIHRIVLLTIPLFILLHHHHLYVDNATINNLDLLKYYYVVGCVCRHLETVVIVGARTFWLSLLLLLYVVVNVVCRLRCRTTAPSRLPVRIIATTAALILVAVTALTIAARCCYAATNYTNTTTTNIQPPTPTTLVELTPNHLNSLQQSDSSLNLKLNLNSIHHPSRFKRSLRATAPTNSNSNSNNNNNSNRNVPTTIRNHEKGNNILNQSTNNNNNLHLLRPHTIHDDELSVIVRTLNNTNPTIKYDSKQQVLVNSVSAGHLSANQSPQVTQRNLQNNNNKAGGTAERLMPSVHVLTQPTDTVIEPGAPDHQQQLKQSVDVPAVVNDSEDITSEEEEKKNSSIIISGGIGLLLLVVSASLLTATLGLITCVVSHYRGGDGGGAPTAPNNTPPATQDAAAATTNTTTAHHCLLLQQQQSQPTLHITAPMLSVMSASAAAGVGAAMDNAGMGGGHHHHHRHHHHHHHHVAMSRELAAQRDRQVRLHSVHTDLELDLPPSITLPDGEELPYGSSARLHIRDAEQESEIYQKCIRPPPNRTVFESESPPPYRSSSAGLLGSLGGSTSTSTSNSSGGSSSDWSGGNTPLVVRCHSMSSSSSTSKHRSEPQKTDFLQRTVKIFTGKKSQSQTAQPPPPQQQQQHLQQPPLTTTVTSGNATGLGTTQMPTAPTLPVVIVPTRPRHPQNSQTHQGAPPRTSSRSGHV